MSNSLSKDTLIKWAIILGLTAICLIIPEQGFYTMKVKLYLAIVVFSLALAAFEAVHEMVIAIVMPVLWIVLGVADVKTVMSSWTSTTTLMIIGAFMMAATLEDSGILKRLAYWMMCKAKGSYFKLLFAIFIVGVILNILTSGRAYIIMGALGAGLCMSLGCMKTKMGAGIAMAVMIGGCTSHAFTYQATMWGVILNGGAGYLDPAYFTPFRIMWQNSPLFLMCLVMIVVFAKMYQPKDGIGEITYFENELKAMGTMTKREKTNGLMMAILLVFIFTADFHHLDVNLGFALIPFMVFLPGLDGADNNTVKKFNYSMIFFVMSCMAIGTVGTSLGLGTVLAEVCTSLLGGSTSPFVVVAMIIVIVFVLNFLMTPLAIFGLIIAPVCVLAANIGMNPIGLAYAVNVCTEAIILPYEFVPYLVVYGFSMITMNDFIKANIIRSIIFFVGVLAIMVPFWSLLGLF